MYAGSPYSPFFTSGLYPSQAPAPAFTNPFSFSPSPPVASSSWLEDELEDDEDVYIDAPRRGSLPTSTHTHTTAATTSYNGYRRNRASSRTGSSFYFTLQPTRDEKEFRSFLSLDLAESASLASAASLKRKPASTIPPVSPKMTTNAKRLSLTSRKVPSPKPAPSASLPSIPLPPSSSPLPSSAAPSPPSHSRAPSPASATSTASPGPSPRPSRAPTPLASAPKPSSAPTSASSTSAPRLPSISIPKITLSVSLKDPVASSSHLSTSAPPTTSPISSSMRISRTPTPTTSPAQKPNSTFVPASKKKTHARTSTLSTVSTRARRMNRSVALDRLEGRTGLTPPPPALLSSSSTPSPLSSPSSSSALPKPTSAPPSIAHFSLRRNFMSLSDDESDSSSEDEDVDSLDARSDYSDDAEDDDGHGRADFFELGGMWLQAEEEDEPERVLPVPTPDREMSEWISTATTGGSSPFGSKGHAKNGSVSTGVTRGSVSMSMALGHPRPHRRSGMHTGHGHGRFESTSTAAGTDVSDYPRGTSFQARPFTHSTGGMKSGHKPSTRRRFAIASGSVRVSGATVLSSTDGMVGTRRKRSGRTRKGVEGGLYHSFIDLRSNTESFGSTEGSKSPEVHRHPTMSFGSTESGPVRDSGGAVRDSVGSKSPAVHAHPGSLGSLNSSPISHSELRHSHMASRYSNFPGLNHRAHTPVQPNHRAHTPNPTPSYSFSYNRTHSHARKRSTMSSLPLSVNLNLGALALGEPESPVGRWRSFIDVGSL